MRELKFRAWDKDKKRFEQIKLMPGGYITRGWGSGGATRNWEQWQQYTGLKDKNGKEIYEGDIVRSRVNDDVHEIAFVDGSFAALHKTQKANAYFWEQYGFEVIGNIYENGDLLK